MYTDVITKSAFADNINKEYEQCKRTLTKDAPLFYIHVLCKQEQYYERLTQLRQRVILSMDCDLNKSCDFFLYFSHIILSIVFISIFCIYIILMWFDKHLSNQQSLNCSNLICKILLVSIILECFYQYQPINVVGFVAIILIELIEPKRTYIITVLPPVVNELVNQLDDIVDLLGRSVTKPEQ